MAYDAKKDITVASRVAVNDGTNTLIVCIQRYNGGEPKIQISRTVKLNNGETQYAKQGRLTFAEWEAVNKAVDQMRAELSSLQCES
jgi:hypothetical protein